MSTSSPTTLSVSALTVPYLGILASLQLIDPSVANIALVKASQAMDMHGATLALAASTSTLAQAATVLVMGFLGDRLGRRRILAASLLLTIAGNSITVLAPDTGLFLVGRAFTGIALGSVLAATFAAVRFVSTPQTLGRALGLWNLLIIIGFILGSLAGGTLANLSWRLAMALVPLISALCLLALPALVPPMPANRELRADGPGLVSIAAAMVLFLYGVSQAVSGLTRVEFWLPTVAGLVLFAVHYQLERRSSQPMFPPGLYERGLFAAAVVSGIGWNFAQSVVQLQTSNFWQVVQRFSTTQVALGQLPLLICFGGGGIVAGRLMRPGRRMLQLMGWGSLVLVAGIALLGGIRADTPYPMLLPALVLVGVGLAFVAVPQSALFVQEAPSDSFGAVTAFRTTTGQLGFALGLAASGAMVSGFGFTDLRLKLLENGVPEAEMAAAMQQVKQLLRNGASTGTDSAGSALTEAIGRSYAQGLAGALWVVAAITALLLIISLLLLIIGREQQLLDQAGVDSASWP